jgi:AbrB family looped-hinge helix DNA binding protein
MNANASRLDELCNLVIGCALTVANTLGSGFVEKVYENALAHTPHKRGLAMGWQLGLSAGEDYVLRMNAKLTLDEAGRVVIPRELRDALHLCAGDTLELESDGQRIILRPVHPTGTMVQEHGVWVFRTGNPLAAGVADETLDRIRHDREPPDQSEPT